MSIRNLTRGASATVIALVTLCLLAGTALAYWTTMGNGFGLASASDLGAPTVTSLAAVTGSSTSVSVTWSHPGSTPNPTDYSVTANGTEKCKLPYPATSCTIGGLAANTPYSVVVTSLLNNAWTAPSAPASATTNVPAPTGFAFTTPANGATNASASTSFVGTTSAIHTVTIKVHTGPNATTAVIRALTATSNGTTWTSAAVSPALPTNATYTAVATQTTPGGTSTAQTTFTVPGSNTLTINAVAAGSFTTSAAPAVSGTASSTGPVALLLCKGDVPTACATAVDTENRTPSGSSAPFSWSTGNNDNQRLDITTGLGTDDIYTVFATQGNGASARMTFRYDAMNPVLTNAASTAAGGQPAGGYMQAGDIYTFTYSEALKPSSVPATVPVTLTETGTFTKQRTFTVGSIISSTNVPASYAQGVNNGTISSTGTTSLSADGKTLTVTLGAVSDTSNVDGDRAGSGDSTGTSQQVLKDMVDKTTTAATVRYRIY